MDYSHLNALNLRLIHECRRLNESKTEAEKELRMVWVEQINKEIKAERIFLGLPETEDEIQLPDDELINELEGLVVDIKNDNRCQCGALFSIHVDGKFQPTNCQGFVLKTDDDHYP